MRKTFICFLIVIATLVLRISAATHTVPAGDIVTLTNLLKTVGTWQTIKLSAGVYDLSSLTNAPMYVGWVGTSLLTCPVGTTITGETSKPEDVILKGPCHYRILVVANGCKIKNLTFSGGNANDPDNSSYDYGGAVTTTGTSPDCNNCIFTNNLARRYGGAVANVNCTDCYFYDNQVTGGSSYGGAGYNGKFNRCFFSGNTAVGDEYGCGGALYLASLVSGCMAVSNRATHKGGALFECKNIKDSTFCFNAAATSAEVNPRGGAACDCGTFTNCVFEYNMASSYGHALCNGSAVGSTFRFNGNAHHGVDGSYCGKFERCTFVGSSIRNAELHDCCIHSISSSVEVVGNVYFGDKTLGNTYGFVDCSLIRNSLISDLWLTNGVNNACFYSNGSIPVKVENCTIVDNVYQYALRNYNSSSCSAAFVNTVFARNKMHNRSTACDMSGYEAKYTSFTNCYIGVMNLVQDSSCGFVDSFVMGKNWNPAFLEEGDCPYATKTRSKLCGAGLILDWMTEDAVDLAGNPRVRDGKVDIGCYQNWLMPLGMSLKVR